MGLLIFYSYGCSARGRLRGSSARNTKKYKFGETCLSKSYQIIPRYILDNLATFSSVWLNFNNVISIQSQWGHFLFSIHPGVGATLPRELHEHFNFHLHKSIAVSSAAFDDYICCTEYIFTFHLSIQVKCI